jgi:FkbM family methyltransferase
MGSMSNWLDSMSAEASFYQRGHQRRRRDKEMDWIRFDQSGSGRYFLLRRFAKKLLYRAGMNVKLPLSIDWMLAHAPELWATREMLADDLSKILFDAALVLRMTSHRHFYFPRIDFDDFVTVNSQKPFAMDNLPQSYLGVPLSLYELNLSTCIGIDPLKIICTEPQIQGLNSYRQYLVRRNGRDLSPVRGDVVIDCGACIGDFSTMFAAMVGPTGQVHAFDPVPLHARYCNLHASLNPGLAPSLHFNTLAVGDRTYTIEGSQTDSEKINPGALEIDSFSCTTLDDYCSTNVSQVDFIKMDIEGAEMAAIEGASKVIREFKPRLAISGYHKPEDLWEIPQKLKDLNPGYELTFGHHSPVHWESVFYAVQR